MKYATTVTVMPLDLTLPDAVETLATALAAADIRLATVVNNAGFGSHGQFVDLDPKRIDAEVQLNVSVLVALSREFLPQLIESAGARKISGSKTSGSKTSGSYTTGSNANSSALVNVASTAAFQPLPRMAVYGATKAFVLSFTEALAYETRGSGVKVLALCPGPTHTEFADVADNDDAMFGVLQTAEQVVTTAFDALDARHTPASVISGAMNSVQATAVRFAPRRFVLGLVGRMGAPKKR